MGDKAKRWTYPYCHVTKTSPLKPPSEKCSHNVKKDGTKGFHKWERTG